MSAEKERDNDPVNHPSHYTNGLVECIEAIEASLSQEAYKGYLKGCALKYLWRYEKKGKSLEDIQKSMWYTKRLAEYVERENRSLKTTTPEDNLAKEISDKINQFRGTVTGKPITQRTDWSLDNRRSTTDASYDNG